MDGSGADSCNDLICLCAWRWKDRTPPERIAPSFSVNRVNYLYNEICKVVNFSSSLFLPSQLFTLPRTFWVLSSFTSLSCTTPPPSTPHPWKREKKEFVSLPLVTSINIITSHFAFYSKIVLSHFLPLHPPNCSAPFSFSSSLFPSTPLSPPRSTSLIAVFALSLF